MTAAPTPTARRVPYAGREDEFLSALDGVIARLAAKGYSASRRWWRRAFEAFVRSGRRRFVLRCGRRSGKSTSLEDFAIAFTLWAARQPWVPRDTIAWTIFVSVSREEAGARLRSIRSKLDDLGVRYVPDGDTIVLEGTRVGFRVQSATIASVSGWTALMVVADEVAKWRDRETGQNPATEVLRALRPTLATTFGVEVLSSSAMGVEDAHAKAYEEGDNADQVTAGGPTWECNETLTERDCRALESHEPTFLREYANVPQSGSVGALDVDGLIACVRDLHYGAVANTGAELVLDASGGRHDSFVASIFQWITELCGELPLATIDVYDARGRLSAREATPARDQYGRPVPNPKWHEPMPRLALLGMISFEGDIASTMTTSQVARAIKSWARPWGVTRVHGDQHGEWSWRSEFAQLGLTFEGHTWTNTTKIDAVARLRELIRNRTLVIAPTLGDEGEKLVAEARSFGETITASGAISYGARGRAKDDRIATLLTACMADVAERLHGSPLKKPSIRIDW